MILDELKSRLLSYLCWYGTMRRATNSLASRTGSTWMNECTYIKKSLEVTFMCCSGCIASGIYTLSKVHKLQIGSQRTYVMVSYCFSVVGGFVTPRNGFRRERRRAVYFTTLSRLRISSSV